MTQLEFIQECTRLTIDPALALESEDIVAALRNRDHEEVMRILTEDF